jgi:hypothetical protein
MMTWLKLAFLLYILGFTVLADDDDDDRPTAKTPQATKQTGIRLKPKTQQDSGIATLKLTPASHRAELTAFGKVLSIQPLLALRHRYLTTITEHSANQAQFKQATQSIARQQTLYREGITAKRDLEAHEAQWQIEQAQLKATQFQDQTIKQEALLNWGDTLSAWALSNDMTKLNSLLSGQTKLVQITLPSGQQLADNAKNIYIAATGQRDKAYLAEFISAAPQTDVSTQSSSYFFQTKAKNISVGMNVTAWLPEQQAETSGVMIPKSALLWSMDQAFVYVKTTDTEFTRRAIHHYTQTEHGYFVSEDLQPNEELVVTGGQMLLSEEMRGQIPDED